jgi:endo-1,4-beta-xylanase
MALAVLAPLFGACRVQVTPAGVRFSFAADDLVVDVPPDAVVAELTMTAVALPEPAGANSVPNTAFSVTPADGWSLPVRVTLAYALSDVPAGVEPSGLRMMRRVPGGWAPLETSSVDVVARTVSADLLSLGQLAIGWEGCDRRYPSTCSLREAAAVTGLRMGATLDPAQVGDAAYTEVLHREFDALTPENALKMYSIQNQRGVWTFAGADAVVGNAEANGMEVRGHTLVWAQDTYTPAWVAGITDPAELQAVTDEYIATVVGRYAGRIPRWDVVNEPLATYGTSRSGSVWDDLLGAGWIAAAFRTAHAADPAAELWINEYGTDWVPGKHAAFLSLVAALVADGVPVHGVGIQTHRTSTAGPDVAVFRRQLEDFAALGLKVAITELDIPTDPTGQGAAMAQAAAYRRIVEACLAVPACVEVTTWGITDADTWLDGLGIFRTPTRPLLFDEHLQPKPAHRSVLAALCRPGGPSRGT